MAYKGRLRNILGGVQETYLNDPGDKLTSVTWTGGSKTFTYDNIGRRKTMTTGGATTTYNWDHESRITSITKPGMTTNTFGYNGLDARVSKTDSSGTRTYRRDGAYVTDPVLSDGAATYTPGVSESRSSTSRWLHSGIKNADSRTLTNQSVEATRDYDAFGNATTTGTWNGPFGYGGAFQYFEATDPILLSVGHRYLDTSIGGFLSRDPAGAGRTGYEYALNNPVNCFDRAGLEPEWLVFGREVLVRLIPGTPQNKHAGNTSLAALGSSLSLGFWDGGEYANEPGFNQSRIAWGVAELAITRGAKAPLQLAAKGISKKLGGQLLRRFWNKAGYLLGTSKNAADAAGKAAGFAKLGIKGDNVLNRLQVLDWIMKAKGAKGVTQANGRILRKIKITGPNGRKAWFHTVWDGDNFITGHVEVFK